MEGLSLVTAWWIGMCFLPIINLCLLWKASLQLKNKTPEYSKLLKHTRRWLFALAAIYVVGCGFRSVFPREDITRVVLFDSWISSVVIGRSVATIAELSFALQWAFVLYEIGKSTANRIVLFISKIIVPLLILAECFSWYACTTSNFRYTVFEESLWAFSATLFFMALIISRPSYIKEQKKFITALSSALAAYIIYMLTVDIPSYYRYSVQDNLSGKDYLTFKQGFIDIATHWTASQSIEDWRYAMVWMTLYFSVAVWLSIYFVVFPRMDRNCVRN